MKKWYKMFYVTKDEADRMGVGLGFRICFILLWVTWVITIIMLIFGVK